MSGDFRRISAERSITWRRTEFWRRTVAELGGKRLYGLPAWLLWSLVHVFLLIGFRNRIAVMGEWIWAYATRTGSSPLITEYHSAARERTH